MNEKLRISLLYFEDCPSWMMAKHTLEIIMQNHNFDADIQLLKIETDQAAKTHCFVGSPSIRVNGEDLFPVDHESYALGCRVYHTPDGMRGWPTAEMIEERLTMVLE